MHAQITTALVAGLAVGASAGAIKPPRIGTVVKDFSARQVPAPHYVRSGPVAMAKVYSKYGKKVPDELAATVAKIKGHHKHKPGRRDSGGATTTPEQYDSEYLTPVSIGTPAQVLNLDFDTGSSDLWVFSTETSQTNGQTLYNPSDSSTAQQLNGATWNITYGDGSSSSGDVYTDVVSIGGVTAQSQAVESAQQVSDQFESDPSSSGLLGLAFSSINTVQPQQQTTFFDTVKSQLDSPVFTADLKHNAPGTYNFGFIDNNAFTGSIAYTPVDNSQGFWSFTSSGYAIGSSSFTRTSTAGIADTGTTLLLLPSSIVKAYYKKVSGAKNDNSQGGYVFPCSTSLPSFTFGVGSSKITIPSQYMNYAPISDGSSTCFGGLQSSSGIGINIYGDIALKSAFVVFDGGNNQLGWASKDLS